MYPADKSFVAVVFATAERLKQIQAYAKEAQRPLILVNPQWRNAGQVISDFGIGPWKKAADDFLGTFEQSYSLKERRIGSPGACHFAELRWVTLRPDSGAGDAQRPTDPSIAAAAACCCAVQAPSMPPPARGLSRAASCVCCAATPGSTRFLPWPPTEAASRLPRCRASRATRYA